MKDWLFKLSGYPISAAKKEIQRLNKLSKDELQQHAEEKKWEVVRHHFATNDVYNKLCNDKLPATWNELPILTKKDLQGNISNLLSKGFTRSNTYFATTSGSSGHPFFFAKDKFAHALTWAYIESCYREHGIKPNDLQARFYGIPLERSKYYIEKLKDFLLNRVRFSVFDLSDETLNAYVNTFRTRPFKYVYGYTNSIVLFARYLIQQKIVLSDICPTLSVCIVTSEVCTEEDKRLIKSAMGINVIREYGASEVCIIAFETPDNTWSINNKTILVEVTESGKLLCTSLYNKAFPIIRYEIGDMGTIISDPEGRPVLKELLGRTNDTIVLPSGKISPGLTFYYISRSILESSGILKEFIIRQTAIDTFVFDILSDADITPELTAEIQTKAERYLEPGIKIIVNRTTSIKRPQSGKLKHFYSEISK